MKKSFSESLEVTTQIMETVVSKFEVEGDLNQMKISIHPIIANAMYNRDNELLEQERFKTLITLARTLNDGNLGKVIKALNYKLIIK
jgi:hypothetical protein